MAQPPLTVLLAEPDLPFRALTAFLLRAKGHAVEECATGASAVTATTMRHFDVVILATRLPRLDGIETARLIRAVPGPAPAIIGLSAIDRAQEYLAAGMSAFLRKPASPQRLVAEIERWGAPAGALVQA